ncbi:PGF-CTERM sorting domain-containing protein [Halobacterium wangiae]|uniref:PGF-CTERM sorting domain-containing protein n=1 Tax=Halobacterium wangiae TaxID=2902623 RepID=UPI001E28A066|nr:PGF-CTERM sorting domain-containing protein [Halobacterium wangiae]
MTKKATAVLLAVLLAASAVSTAAAATATGSSVAASEAQDGSAYAGTHVTFDVAENAVANYSVGGETALDSVKVQSGSESDGVFDGSVDLSAVTSISGSALSLSASANANAEVSTEGSASMTAHDNSHGILVVEAAGDDQVVVANVSSGADAEAESDQQVEVTTANGTQGAFIVVGNGSVAVNDDGDVSAQLEGDSRLVFRAYPDGKSEQSEQTESYIASGKATGEVYVDQQDGELVTDTVAYSQETAIEAEQSAEDTVSVTVERAREEGKIVVTSVSEAAVGAVSDLDVTVDGEAAAEASTYGELESAIGGDASKYMVKQSSSAEASAKVYVALNHFSQRNVEMQGSDGGTETTDGGSTTAADTADSGDGGETGGDVPGFGVGVALVALVGAALFAVRQ